MDYSKWTGWLNLLMIQIRSLFSRVPIFGGLVSCTTSNHAAALKEFSVLFGFGTATFWLSALIASFFAANSEKSLYTLLKFNVSNGELFIFAVSLLGPIFYTALDEPGWATRQFPEKQIHLTLTALLAAIAAAAFAFVKTGTPMNEPWLFTVSVWVAGIAILLRYLTIAYTKMRATSPHQVQADQESAFLERAAKHAKERQAEPGAQS